VSPPIRVLVADDHAVVRRGLRQILEAEPDIEVVAEATNGAEAVALVREQDVDVALLDITMPGRSGLEVLRELRGVRPGLRVLVLSMHPEERYAVRVLKEGAAGYLTKESAPEELVSAVRKVAAGGRYIGVSLAERLAGEISTGSERPAYELLSGREYEIMCRLAAGKTVGQIAAELALGVNTVSTYRARVLQKLGLDNNAELMRYALHHQLID
jgi:DNA-binding NarL/FixJ family response regulator